MATEYTSFLLRCWQLPGGERRIRVEHVQSGRSARVATLDAAIAWLDANWEAMVGRGGASEDEQDDPAAPPRASPPAGPR